MNNTGLLLSVPAEMFCKALPRLVERIKRLEAKPGHVWWISMKLECTPIENFVPPKHERIEG